MRSRVVTFLQVIFCALALASCGNSRPPLEIPSELVEEAPGYTGPATTTEREILAAAAVEQAGRLLANQRLTELVGLLVDAGRSIILEPLPAEQSAL